VENVFKPVDNLLKIKIRKQKVYNVKSYEQFSTHYKQALKCDFTASLHNFHISTLTTITTTNYFKSI